MANHALAEQAGTRRRIESLDCLRGMVMVLMALDHARDFVGDVRVNPTDLEGTTPALFLTRWITHFCAPTFVFLAGTSAYLFGQSCGSTRKLAPFLWTRGIWLLWLEATVIYYGWINSFASGVWLLQVIGAIALSLIMLGFLVFLPRTTVLAIGLLLIVCHNLLDPVQPQDFGRFSWLWTVLHEGRGVIPWGPISVLVVYPVLPWIGVIALGYGFGTVVTMPEQARGRIMTRLGCSLIGTFLVVRSINVYGDPTPWSIQSSIFMTVASFLNVEKYPPSLLFLCITLGPAILALAVVDRLPSNCKRFFLVFGRVALFYYVAHLYLLHAASRLFHYLVFGKAFSSMQTMFTSFGGQTPQFPAWYGQPLGVVYTFWVLSVLTLYPICIWYGRLKQRGPRTLMSYL